MKVKASHSYRHAEAILEKEYPAERAEILAALEEAEFQYLPEPKERKRHGKVVAVLTINQNLTNKVVEEAFESKGWEARPTIISASKSKLKADFKKSKVQVEVQFGNMARWYTDVFKFLLSYSADDIEVGVLVVPDQRTARRLILL